MSSYHTPSAPPDSPLFNGSHVPKPREPLPPHVFDILGEPADTTRATFGHPLPPCHKGDPITSRIAAAKKAATAVEVQP
jgi:hypothetical protein